MERCRCVKEPSLSINTIHRLERALTSQAAPGYRFSNQVPPIPAFFSYICRSMKEAATSFLILCASIKPAKPAPMQTTRMDRGLKSGCSSSSVLESILSGSMIEVYASAHRMVKILTRSRVHTELRIEDLLGESLGVWLSRTSCLLNILRYRVGLCLGNPLHTDTDQ